MKLVVSEDATLVWGTAAAIIRYCHHRLPSGSVNRRRGVRDLESLWRLFRRSYFVIFPRQCKVYGGVDSNSTGKSAEVPPSTSVQSP